MLFLLFNKGTALPILKPSSKPAWPEILQKTIKQFLSICKGKEYKNGTFNQGHEGQKKGF
jgi:hypothetical protein